MRIHIEGLHKRFGPTVVLDDIHLDIREREFIGLLGPSGSGKTTLLRILAGLEVASHGRILLDGEDAQTLRSSGGRSACCFSAMRSSIT